MKTIISSRTEADKKAAAQVKSILERKNSAVIALSPGETVWGLYAELADMVRRGELSLANARFFTLCEFEGTDLCRRMIKENFLDRTDAAEENCVFLSADDPNDIDDRIGALGGLDLAVLDIGANARIGFNEPATPFDSLTHIQRLAPATRREMAALCGGEENVPELGVTLGIKTITLAKEIMLLAYGEEQAEPVFRMLYGRNDSAVPAAFLQVPANVAAYLDEAAAKKL